VSLPFEENRLQEKMKLIRSLLIPFSTIHTGGVRVRKPASVHGVCNALPCTSLVPVACLCMFVVVAVITGVTDNVREPTA
jgi:hypothetical protein